MRQIKFRAWDKEAKMMVDVGYDIGNLLAQKSLYEVMQFTGLKDKNAREIYEGDVLRADRGGNHEVVWEDKYSCFTFFSIEAEDDRRDAWYPNQSLDGLKVQVIGNIYENPELLSA